MGRRLAIVIAVATVGLSTEAFSTEQPTIVHRYAPFKAGKLAPDLQVTATLRGYCPSESGLMNRPYAWRCFSRNFILDPCFSTAARRHIVVCPERPWSKRARVIRLTRALPSWTLEKHRKDDAPWGIWTTTGQRCFLLSHWQGEVARRLLTYNCVGGGVLAGLPHRRQPSWTIYYAPSWRSNRVTLVGISDAWS